VPARAAGATDPQARHVVVVGGGIAGAAAACALHAADPSLAVTVLEASGRIGGKLRVSEVAGVPVDVGAEALLARRPEALDLVRAVRLEADLEHPVTTSAAVWSRGRLRPLPPTLLGVPADLRGLARSGILSAAQLARVPFERAIPRRRSDSDVAVGELVTRRLGRGVLDRLVEPLLGGVYAGHAEELSVQATAPVLAKARADGRSLLAVASAVVRQRSGEPVFAGVRGGVGRLPGAVLADSAARVRTGVTVREISRLPGDRWRLVAGPVPAPEVVEADAVIVAVPAPAASRLLGDVAAPAAVELAGIDYASVGIVTLAFPATAFPRPLAGSGFLVPPSERRLVKASTYSSAKWRWVAEAAGETVLVRCSVGRHREVADLQRDDADLVDAAAADFAAATGAQGPPVDARVTRWGGSLPQYAVGHLQRVDRIRAAVARLPGLEVCGAAYEGLGVPACIATATAAAARVGDELQRRATMQP
jgi:protoporphyrinogen/coproporphyrinogen III oxidase